MVRLAGAGRHAGGRGGAHSVGRGRGAGRAGHAPPGGKPGRDPGGRHAAGLQRHYSRRHRKMAAGHQPRRHPTAIGGHGIAKETDMTHKTGTLRIGSGAGWWGDRIDPARWNAERGALDFLCFETMAEATVSAAQVRKRRDPGVAGYDTWLDDRMRAVLPHCMANGTRIVSNQGWIHPLAAARRVAELCAEAGWKHARVAAVSATDLSGSIGTSGLAIMESGAPVASVADTLISAEPYAGAEAIVRALDQGADIVITGRVADPSLFLAPMMHHFGWRAD